MSKPINPLAEGIMRLLFLPKEEKREFIKSAAGDFVGTVLEMAGSHIRSEAGQPSDGEPRSE